LLGTTGGVSALIAYAVTPQLRAWSRLSVFIAFFSLAAIGLLLDAGRERLRRRTTRAAGPAVAAVLAAVVVIGALDQTGASSVPPYSTIAEGYRSDAAFVEAIERSMAPGAMILQLPYLPFPEPGPLERMRDYDLLRPYLHSRELRWSYGAMEGRPEDWHAELANAPAAELIPMVAAAGFDGIYVDRFGYGDRGQLKETELAETLKAPPETSPDGRFSFFDLRPYNRTFRATHSPAAVDALAAATLRPLRPEWEATPHFEEVREALNVWRWITGPNARLHVVNPSPQERRATLSMTLGRAGTAPAPVSLGYPDGTRQDVQVAPQGTPVQQPVTFQPGLNVIEFSTSAPPVEVRIGDENRSTWFKVVGFRLIPEESALNG
jgi:phosphoglycerol transferase